jgi:SAM-dependent methyltransferase
LRNFINYGKYNNASLFLRIGENARRKMFACFMDIVKPSANDTVLDIGVTPNNGPVANNFFEKLYPYTRNITMCSIEDASCLEQDFPGAKFVRNYPGQPLPFGNKQFDVVVCWAVIEHVGDYPQQFDFLNELLRVGKRLYLTTPNKLFPIELHTALPFVHWLPRKIHQRILKILGITFYADTKNLNLLTAANLRGMLKSIICTPPPPPPPKIFFQKICGVGKNNFFFFVCKIY